jgi:hypothetical protein
VDVVETSMLKRIVHGRPFGVVVLAEGLGLRLPEDELAQAMPEGERDEHGHVRLAELELDRLLARQVKDRFRARGRNVPSRARTSATSSAARRPSRSTSSTPATWATGPSIT